MRAFWRRALAPLIMAAAALSAAGPAQFAVSAVHASVPLAECPAGTNWDHTLNICD